MAPSRSRSLASAAASSQPEGDSREQDAIDLAEGAKRDAVPVAAEAETRWTGDAEVLDDAAERVFESRVIVNNDNIDGMWCCWLRTGTNRLVCDALVRAIDHRGIDRVEKLRVLVSGGKCWLSVVHRLPIVLDMTILSIWTIKIISAVSSC
jgi:hypothetical protein